jgi:taurine dioxygenase
MRSYSTIQVEPQPEGFGAEIRGLRPSEPLPPATLNELKIAWARHSVLAFPDQPLSHEQLEAFTLRLGEFGDDPYIVPMAGHPNILELRREATETSTNFGAAWHSDWSFQPCPPAGTVLHAKVVPPVGGDTLYADCYRAFETLSPAFQHWLVGLRAVHSAAWSYGRKGVYAKTGERRAMQFKTGEDAEKTRPHPLVRTHPVTGRKALYVSPVYTVAIEGLNEHESALILGYLFKHIVQPQFIYRHRWQPDMLTLWDNRCTLHNAEGGYDGHLRLMHRCTIAGDVPV